jgi:hypothetical protein
MGVALSRDILAEFFSFCMSGKHRTAFHSTNRRLLKNMTSSASNTQRSYALPGVDYVWEICKDDYPSRSRHQSEGDKRNEYSLYKDTWKIPIRVISFESMG